MLLVGDAAGYVDALTGEGIALGLAPGPRGGRRPSRRATRRRTSAAGGACRWRHNLLTHGLLAASGRPALRRRLVPAADAVPWLFRAAVNELARPA